MSECARRGGAVQGFLRAFFLQSARMALVDPSTQARLRWCRVLGLDAWAPCSEAQVRAAARRALLEAHPDKSGRRTLDPSHILKAKSKALAWLALARWHAATDPAEPMDLD